MKTNIKSHKQFEVGKSYKTTYGTNLLNQDQYYKIVKIDVKMKELYVQIGDDFLSYPERWFDINNCLEDTLSKPKLVFAVVDHAGTIAVYSNEKSARDHVSYYDYGYVKQFTVKDSFNEELKDSLKADIKKIEKQLEQLKGQLNTYD